MIDAARQHLLKSPLDLAWSEWQVRDVPASEAARHDLYNGLTELLGPQRAETLMAALPTYDTSELVTKSDLALFGTEMKAELSELGARVSQLEVRMTAVESALVAINLRLDRMFLALVRGLIVIVAAMIGTAFMP